MAREFSTQELADRWYDRRNVTNLVGKYVSAILLHQQATIFERFWTQQEDACLSFNDGSYVGSADVRGYFATMAENTAKVSKLLQQIFPEQLGSLSDEALYGAGQLRGLPVTTPVIEIAADGKTAKGIWHIQGSDNGLSVYGPLSYWSLGFLAVDFRREGDEWRIWHLFHAEDVVAPMGESWLKPKTRVVLDEYAVLSDCTRPPYTVERENYIPYSARRPFSPPPAVPVPYESFADTFSYGIE